MIHTCVVKTKVPSSDIQPTIARDTRWILQGWHIFVSSLCQQVVIFASFLESFHLSKPHGTALTAKRSEVVSNNGCKKRDQVNNPPYLNLSIHCWWCDSTMLKVQLMSCSPLRHHVASYAPPRSHQGGRGGSECWQAQRLYGATWTLDEDIGESQERHLFFFVVWIASIYHTIYTYSIYMYCVFSYCESRKTFNFHGK